MFYKPNKNGKSKCEKPERKLETFSVTPELTNIVSRKRNERGRTDCNWHPTLLSLLWATEWVTWATTWASWEQLANNQNWLDFLVLQSPCWVLAACWWLEHVLYALWTWVWLPKSLSCQIVMRATKTPGFNKSSWLWSWIKDKKKQLNHWICPQSS